MDAASAVNKAISDHLADLVKPGVLTIRPGYAASGGWLTRKPAIVVTVADKHDPANGADRLPETVGGYPVDIRQGSPMQRMGAASPALFASVQAAARPEMERPTFPFERDGSGRLLTATHEMMAAARRPSKPQIDYQPPAGASLSAIEDDMTITCHASPDAGWPTLKAFLGGVQTRLTVAMYDFTSAHVLAAVQQAATGRPFSLVLDRPAPNKTRDQTDDQTVASLNSALDGTFAFAWALERMDVRAASWIYPNAYHIKVAVRDGTAFWLSSGNWNNSNQPDIDPIADPAGSATVAKNSDRDWHVIVEHPGLAQLYETFIKNDLAVAADNQATGASQDFTAAVGELAEAPLAVAARNFKTFFPPQRITDRMKIQPILTPDNYVDLILPFITSAQTSFWMQTQYIHPSSRDGDERLAALIEAVAQKIKQGVDVRIIMSEFETMDKLELLQDAGIDLSTVRIQANVHNKGMIVDGAVVAVGSQNWSADGVLRNRDATLIIYNQQAAQYWAQLFVHDWTNMASQQAAD